MKYALNHPWKFDSVNQAYTAGLLQAAAIFIIELSGFALLLLAQSIEKIALYLVTVAVISHLDNLAYKSAGNFEFKAFITKLSQSKGALLKV